MNDTEQATMQTAIRDVLLSEEFLTAFAEAVANAEIPSTIQVLETQPDWSEEPMSAEQVAAIMGSPATSEAKVSP